MTNRIGPEHLSVPERLAAARAHVSRLCARLFPDGCRADIGRQIDRCSKHVARCCDENVSVSWQLPDAYLLGDEERIAIAQDLLGDRYLVIEAPEAERADSIAAACEMMAQAGELSGEIAASYRDGAVDRAEGARGAPIALRVARLALGAHRVFALAVREGVVGLRAVRTQG